MTIKVDPEENETGALLDFVDLDGGRVLEIGSGDGRLTWRYAERAAQVTAVEPFAPAVMRAREHLPQELEGRVVLREAAFAEFAAQAPRSAFDVTIFSWSLCCMERDGMVPALEEVHRLLRPSGTLIDIHPVFGTAQLEVHSAGQVIFAEPASASPDEGVLQADDALAHVVGRGLLSQSVIGSSTSASTARPETSWATSLTRRTRTRTKVARRRAMRSRPSCSRGWTASWLAKRARRKSPITNGCGLLG